MLNPTQFEQSYWVNVDKDDEMLKNGLKFLFFTTFAVLMYTDLKAQENLGKANDPVETISSERSYELDKIEELFVEGERPTGADMDLLEMDRVHQHRGHAGYSG